MGRKNNKRKTIMISIVLVFTVILLGLMLGNKNKNEKITSLERREKTEKVSLLANSKYGESEIEIELLPIKLDDVEVIEIYTQFKSKLLETILGGNESFDDVKEDLHFVDRLEGYPFEISYSLRPRGYISEKGEIIKGVDDSTRIEVLMSITYEEYEFEDSIWVNLSSRTKSEMEVFDSALRESLENINMSNRDIEAINLPEIVDGEPVTWEINKKSKIPGVLFLIVVVTAYLLTRSYFQRTENEKKRLESIKRAYPGFASKYALLLGTGLPHRQILERMIIDYSRDERENAMYEELKKVTNEIQSGLSQTEALNNMARRCRLRELTQFVSLINQNIRKGGDNITEQLRAAATESIEIEKEETRKQIERAGTKLLFPMTIILILVFLVIMIPAFNSFSM